MTAISRVMKEALTDTGNFIRHLLIYFKVFLFCAVIFKKTLHIFFSKFMEIRTHHTFLVTSAHWTLSWLLVAKSVFQRAEGLITLETEVARLAAPHGRETCALSSRSPYWAFCKNLDPLRNRSAAFSNLLGPLFPLQGWRSHSGVAQLHGTCREARRSAAHRSIL